ncbi:MAG: RluA family pseudouridine synthase [Planctomycetes bacterium]|nr:RluA family pseudouridine synthase [Planctomycetota bacterium]MCB9913133.1 RluA family pseudouridine synthase [Planctomycetota bacterium]HPF14448.1 RluA family pseudouridine synthase [Planctomycetota bacterium]HRV80816.1 RluA family pseudouridine synthase [Planctomycetota bacterium]
MARPPFQPGLTISSDWAGRRLDLALVDFEPGLSRSRWQALIRAGHVTLQGEPVLRPGHLLEGGEILSWEIPEVPPTQDSQGQVVRDLPIVHLDDAICVINKPAGLLSHRNHAAQALAVPELLARAIGHLPEGAEPMRPGIVHRLDRGTSGLMVLARTPEAMEFLLAAFAERQVQKTYAALVMGTPRFDSEYIDAPIERDPRKPERRRIARPGEGKPASTLIEVVERFGDVACLCHAHPKTGRTHQLRVHLASRDLPIMGDSLYRPRHVREDALPDACRRLARPALHAASLSFTHPTTGEPVAFHAELPEDMRLALEALRNAFA